MLEAIAAGAVPLLPDRLSYPEVVNERWHDAVLYSTVHELKAKLHAAIEDLSSARDSVQGLSEWVLETYSWDAVVQGYDRLIDEVV